MRSTCFLAGILLLAAPAAAEADHLVVAAAVGGGILADATPGHGQALGSSELDLRLGYRVAPRWAIALETASTQHVYLDGAVFFHTMELVSLELRPVPRLWLRGSIGLAQAVAHDAEGFTLAPSRGPALAGAVGVVLWRGRRNTVGLELRVAHADYEDNSLTSGALLLAVRR